MGIGSDLADLLREHRELRKPLLAELGGNASPLTAYYLCPLSTLPAILEEGIKCRNAGNLGIDLSSSDIQARRTSVSVARDTGTGADSRRSVRVHNSINLFWNPLNTTFEAFQRNALIRGAATRNSADQVVCIVEIDAGRILRQETAYWCATQESLAKGGTPTFILNTLRQFDWAGVFLLASPDVADYRAAELVFFFGDAPQSSPLHPSHIRRVLVPPGTSVPNSVQRTLGHVLVAEVSVYKPPHQLLRAEAQFLSTLNWLEEKDGQAAKRICYAIQRTRQFESAYGGPEAGRFLHNVVSYGPHGVGHAVRVMFWAAFLGSYLREARDSAFMTALLMSAMIHDLDRPGNWEDETHGGQAARRWREFVRGRLADDGADSCLSAVTMHCKADDKCTADRQDLTWKILKDADALDRGRFAAPDKPRGCDSSQVRSRWARNQQVQWLAFWLAAMSKHTKWGTEPAADLDAQLGGGVVAALGAKVVSSKHGPTARRLLACLNNARGS